MTDSRAKETGANCSGASCCSHAVMMSAVKLHHDAERLLEAIVERRFPIGSKVQIGDKEPIVAVVHALVAGFPDRLAIRFENGNVWDKPVSDLTPVV